MKQFLIKIILFIKNKIPEKYHFLFIGFFSYIYNYINILINNLFFLVKKNKYLKSIKKIDHKGKKIFVFLYTTDFHDIHQRPQHLAKAFSMRNDCIVLFMTKNQTKDNVDGIERINNNLYLINNYKIINEFTNYNLILVGPSHYKMLNYLRNYKKIIYDFPDELDFFPGISKKIIKAYHNRILIKSDLCTPSADYLEKLLLSDNSKISSKVVLNGVFPDDFLLEKDEINNIPISMKKNINGKKIVGFYGGLGEGRIDFNLIKYLITNRPDFRFIIIGGGNINFLIKKYKFYENDNITFLGPKPYLELKHYAKLFDVAIIPFKLNELTLGVSPVKSFEYMVQGIPFVSTALPECLKYKNVLIGNSYSEFSDKLDEGIQLKNDNNYLELLKKEGVNNTWGARVDLIINSIEGIK